MSSRDDEYTEYISARMMSLRRTAYLLCQDWHRADDLVQAAITKLYVHWSRARAADHIDAYARTVLVREFLGERRSAWARRVRLDGPDRGVMRGDQLNLAGTGVRGIPQPMVDVSLAGPGSSCHFYPGGQSQHRTINGIKVVVTRLDPATFQVCAAHAHGLSVFISTYGSEHPRAVSIFRDHLRILGPDPSRWTAQPLG